MLSTFFRLLEDHANLFATSHAIIAILFAAAGFWLEWRRKSRETRELNRKVEKATDKAADLAARLATTEEKLRQITKERDDNKIARSKYAGIIQSERSSHSQQLEALKGSNATERSTFTTAYAKQLTDLKETHGLEISRLDSSHSQATKKADERHEEIVDALTQDLETQRERIAASDRAIARLMRLEGEFYDASPRVDKTPKFFPLPERQKPIISVMNLKGGVGKTTITAYLGAAFAAKGYRVLLVDMDFQGSLSSLFLRYSAINNVVASERALQDYFKAAIDGPIPLKDFVQPLQLTDDTTGGLIVTTDRLGYAEINMSLSWLLNLRKRDTRFLLRRGLHRKGLLNKYDIVLIDCLPFLNTCCANALAASDYVLIPATPSHKSVERIAPTLEAINKLRVNLNDKLRIAGVVFNCTRRGDRLSTAEAPLWQSLLTYAKGAAGEPVRGFKTFIRDSVEIQRGDADYAAPTHGSETATTFASLAAELEEVFAYDGGDAAGPTHEPDLVPSGNGDGDDGDGTHTEGD